MITKKGRLGKHVQYPTKDFKASTKNNRTRQSKPTKIYFYVRYMTSVNSCMCNISSYLEITRHVCSHNDLNFLGNTNSGDGIL